MKMISLLIESMLGKIIIVFTYLFIHIFLISLIFYNLFSLNFFSILKMFPISVLLLFDIYLIFEYVIIQTAALFLRNYSRGLQTSRCQYVIPFLFLIHCKTFSKKVDINAMSQEPHTILYSLRNFF